MPLSWKMRRFNGSIKAHFVSFSWDSGPAKTCSFPSTPYSIFSIQMEQLGSERLESKNKRLGMREQVLQYKCISSFGVCVHESIFSILPLYHRANAGIFSSKKLLKKLVQYDFNLSLVPTGSTARLAGTMDSRIKEQFIPPAPKAVFIQEWLLCY